VQHDTRKNVFIPFMNQFYERTYNPAPAIVLQIPAVQSMTVRSTALLMATGVVQVSAYDVQ